MISVIHIDVEAWEAVLVEAMTFRKWIVDRQLPGYRSRGRSSNGLCLPSPSRHVLQSSSHKATTHFDK
jgi:hypothetical protein